MKPKIWNGLPCYVTGGFKHGEIDRKQLDTQYTDDQRCKNNASPDSTTVRPNSNMSRPPTIMRDKPSIKQRPPDNSKTRHLVNCCHIPSNKTRGHMQAARNSTRHSCFSIADYGARAISILKSETQAQSCTEPRLSTTKTTKRRNTTLYLSLSHSSSRPKR